MQMVCIATAPAQAQSINTAIVHRRLNVDTRPDVHSTRLDSTESKLIIRGSEDLGGGVTANFMMGGGFRADTGSGALCNGDCWLGLRGPLGSIRLGHTLPIYDDISVPWYFVEAQGNHNPASLWANCGNKAGMADGCVDNYLSQTVRYDTPRWNGLSGSVSVSNPSGDLPGPARHADVYAVGGEYRREGLYLGLAHQHQRNVRSEGSVDMATTLSMLYQGWITVGVGIEHLKYSIATGGELERDYMGLLVRHNAGPFTVWANLGRAGKGYGTAEPGSRVNAISRTTDSGATMWTLGGRYRLSKATQVYAYWNQIVNDSQGRYSFDAPPAGSVGWRVSAVALGLGKIF
jgi:predicted porin